MTANFSLQEAQSILEQTVVTLKKAGDILMERFASQPSFITIADVVSAIHANDDAVLQVLKPALMHIRPSAGWVDDELEEGLLADGEWWIVDPVEGNINHIHGMADWAVTATLVRDNQPILTAVYLPLSGDLYTAIQGQGAWQNGVKLSVSEKTHLNATLAGTGQARPGEDQSTFHKIGESITQMLIHGLVVRVSVPATLQLIQVAAGRMDIFWQFSRVRSGLMAGALLVKEAGGCVTDSTGHDWQPDSDMFIACPRQLSRPLNKLLAPIAAQQQGS